MEDRILAEIEPSILVWARERLSATLDIVALKTSISPRSLKLFEDGEKLPTFEQLRKLSQFYRTNISVFFLSEPPSKKDYIRTSLRRISGKSNLEFSIELKRELVNILLKRESLIELETKELNRSIKPVSFLSTDSAFIIRKKIGMNFDIQRHWRDPRVAFNRIRDLLENAGVLVFQVSGIGINEMRACVINEDIYPIIIINRADSYHGRIFSIAHELYHLVKKDDDIEFDKPLDLSLPEEDMNEVAANSFAAEFLIPNDILQSYIRNISEITNKQFYIDKMSKDFCVSKEVVSRTMLDRRLLTKDEYQIVRNEGIENAKLKKKPGMIMPYDNSISLYGKKYSRSVIETYQRHRIGKGIACDLLEIKYKWLSQLSNRL